MTITRFAVILASVLLLSTFVSLLVAPASLQQSTPIAVISYVCKGGDAIVATYYGGVDTASINPDQPPVPGGSVTLRISDGRTLTLRQTISADGVRYANQNESFIFWSKSNTLLILEDDVEKSLVGCVAVAPKNAERSLTHIYADSKKGFSIRIPDGYTNGAHQYQELGLDRSIVGVKFTIPPTLSKGTNLSPDSYVSVEQIITTRECSASLFLETGVMPTTIVDANTTYSVASSTGAGAGNRYEETVYALPGTSPCTALRYFIHYLVIENYPPSTVQEFNKKMILEQFDTIRRSLTIAQG